MATRTPDEGRPRLRRHPTLRSLLRTANTALAVIAVFACVCLILLTTVMRHASENARTSAEALQAAEATRVRLLVYGRDSDLSYLSGQPQDELVRVRREAELFARIDDLRTKVDSDEARQLVSEGERKIREYVAERRSAEIRGGTVQSVVLAVRPSLDAALDAMDQLASMELENVSNAAARTRRLDTIANIVGVSVGGLVLLGFLAIAVIMSRLAFAPLLALAEAIDRIAAGERRTRLEARGTAELQQTANSFNRMAERLERQHADLLTFLAGVAHDLRNPLAALRMSTQYLTEEGRPLPSEEKVRETMALVGRQVSRLERMVGDFLDACRIEAGHLELTKERRDLRELAREAVELYEPSSFSHRLVVSVPSEPVLVYCDAERIAQVMNNLVSNAIKYSPAGGTVNIVISSRGDEAEIAVTDHGIGIAREDLPRIFEPFHRTGASRETIPGVGLGLSVSRQIVEGHGGRIDLSSELGAGSTFRVHLPVVTAAAAEPSAEAAHALDLLGSAKA